MTDITVLTEMDDYTFGELIAKNLGRDAPEELWSAFTDPQVILRTKLVLTNLKMDMQGQLSQSKQDALQVGGAGEEAKQRYFGVQAEQAEWRRKILFKMRLTDRRLNQVKALIPTMPRTPRSPYGPGGTKFARKANRLALETLARAVAQHRNVVLSGDGDESDDETLWEHLNTVTMVNGEGTSLSLIKWLRYLDEIRDDDDD